MGYTIARHTSVHVYLTSLHVISDPNANTYH